MKNAAHRAAIRVSLLAMFTALGCGLGSTEDASRGESTAPRHGASSAEEEDSKNTVCQEKTCLESISIEAGHTIEFHQLESGLVGVIERGRMGQTPVMKAREGVDSVSLADTYKQLKPGVTVPAHLLAADARNQATLLSMKEEAEEAAARVRREMELHPENAEAIEQAARQVPPPERAPSMDEASRFYTADEQLQFKGFYCTPNALQQCYQGQGTWIDSGTVVANVKSWNSFAWVGSEGSKAGTLLMDHLVINNGGFVTDFTTSVPPGHFVHATVNVAPFYTLNGGVLSSGIKAAFHSRLSGMSTSLNSLGTGWGGFCGTNGLPACSNGACALPATNVGGVCLKLCGNLGGDCCTVGPACGSGAAGDTNDVNITCYNPLVGPKNCQACGGDGEDCCGAAQTCAAGKTCRHPLIGVNTCQPCGGDGEDCCSTGPQCNVPGQTCFASSIFSGKSCGVPSSGGAGGTACGPNPPMPCGFTNICPAGSHPFGFGFNSACPSSGNGSDSRNATLCVADCGQTYDTCDNSCDSPYHVLSTGSTTTCALPGGVGGTGFFPFTTCSK